MLNLLRAGLLALACFIAWPALAQECRPFEAMLAEAGTLAAQGFTIDILTGAEAERALSALVAVTGPPPRPLALTAILLLRGEGGAVTVLGEGARACFWLSLRPETARAMLVAAKGVPA